MDKHRILVVSERLSPGFDDGIKNIALNLLQQFRRHHTARGLSETQAMPELEVGLVKTNRWYVSPDLLARVRRFRPDRIIYVPWTSATVRSLFRLKMLQLYSGARTAIVATQPMPLAKYHAVMPLLRPDLALVMSDQTRDILEAEGIRTAFLPAGIEPEKFQPRSTDDRAELRKAFGVSPDAYLVTHVGHLKEERLDPRVLSGILALGGTEVLVVGSTHTPAEDEHVEVLRSLGVKVHRRYLEDVSVVYRMSDCYLFPVRNRFACVGVPLSVIEALACGCPVVSSDFQGLPGLLKPGPHLRFASTPEEMVEQVGLMKASPATDPHEISALVAGFTWEKIATQILEELK